MPPQVKKHKKPVDKEKGRPYVGTHRGVTQAGSSPEKGNDDHPRHIDKAQDQAKVIDNYLSVPLIAGYPLFYRVSHLL
jgi:hypothetical protein